MKLYRHAVVEKHALSEKLNSLTVEANRVYATLVTKRGKFAENLFKVEGKIEIATKQSEVAKKKLAEIK